MFVLLVLLIGGYGVGVLIDGVNCYVNDMLIFDCCMVGGSMVYV